METWEDQGIILSVRPHGDNGGVVSLLTESQGRYAGYVNGARSTRMRGVLEIGSRVDARWTARTADNLGTLKLEQDSYTASGLWDDPLRLEAMMSACALCDATVPEREPAPGMYYGLAALLEALQTESWQAAYVYWEIALLKALGFALDLTSCAGGGDSGALAYVSPRTGCAVSAGKGAPYADRLLPLPAFLTPGGDDDNAEEIFKGLSLTEYFLKNRVFAHHTRGIPDERLRFQARFAKYVESPLTTDDEQGDQKGDMYGTG